MQLLQSAAVTLVFTREELEQMVNQLHPTESIIIRVQLEDAFPLNETAEGHISSPESHERIEFREPIRFQTWGQFLKEGQ